MLPSAHVVLKVFNINVSDLQIREKHSYEKGKEQFHLCINCIWELEVTLCTSEQNVVLNWKW